MTKSILGPILCLTLLACVGAPEPEGQSSDDVSTIDEAIGNKYWYCQNAGPELCVVLPGWFPRSECVAACQSVGIAVPQCVLRIDPACAF